MVSFKIQDKSIDMILSDLPYGVTARNKWDEVIPFNEMWKEINRVIKDNGAIVLFGQGMFTANLMKSNPKMWRYNLIWEKTQPTGFLNAKRMPMRSHEDICIFYKKQPTYNPQMSSGHERKVSTAEHKRNSKATTDYGRHGLSTYDSTERYPRSVWKYAKDTPVYKELYKALTIKKDWYLILLSPHYLSVSGIFSQKRNELMHCL